MSHVYVFRNKKVQESNEQEKVQPEKDFQPKTEVGKNQTNNQVLTDTKKTFSKPNEQLFSPYQRWPLSYLN